MANSYREIFEEEIYPTAFRMLAEEGIRQFDENREKITLEIKNYLNGYLDDLHQLQEVRLDGPVAQMTFSMRYTSFEDKKVEFRIDSYGEGRFVYEDTLLTERLSAPWLTEGMDVFEKELEERTIKEKLRHYIRPAEWEKLKLRALRSLLSYFASRFRYVIQDVLDQKRLAEVNKEENFTISMGEYLDWQKVIFALRSEVDIFNCEPHTSFVFRRFSAIYYEKKNFQECDFQRVDFFPKGALADDNTSREVYYEPEEFLACAITECRIRDSDLRAVQVKDCDIKELSSVNSVATNSGFWGDERITWLEESTDRYGGEEQDGVF